MITYSFLIWLLLGPVLAYIVALGIFNGIRYLFTSDSLLHERLTAFVSLDTPVVPLLRNCRSLQSPEFFIC